MFAKFIYRASLYRCRRIRNVRIPVVHKFLFFFVCLWGVSPFFPLFFFFFFFSFFFFFLLSYGFNERGRY